MDAAQRSRPFRRGAWTLAALVCLGLAVAGIALPVLPTTPFALAGAYCAARGSDRLHTWILGHRVLGPVIRDWNEHRSVQRGAKVAATATMLLSACVLLLLSGAGWLLLGVTGLMATVAVWLWSRPEPVE